MYAMYAMYVYAVYVCCAMYVYVSIDTYDTLQHRYTLLCYVCYAVLCCALQVYGMVYMYGRAYVYAVMREIMNINALLHSMVAYVYVVCLYDVYSVYERVQQAVVAYYGGQ